jgi:hypothetical protein
MKTKKQNNTMITNTEAMERNVDEADITILAQKAGLPVRKHIQFDRRDTEAQTDYKTIDRIACPHIRTSRKGSQPDS